MTSRDSSAANKPAVSRLLQGSEKSESNGAGRETRKGGGKHRSMPPVSMYRTQMAPAKYLPHFSTGNKYISPNFWQHHSPKMPQKLSLCSDGFSHQCSTNEALWEKRRVRDQGSGVWKPSTRDPNWLNTVTKGSDKKENTPPTLANDCEKLVRNELQRKLVRYLTYTGT